MEYVYAAMLLHKAGKKVDEAHLKKVLDAAGVKADEARVKALVAALENVNIDEAVQQAAVAPVSAAPASTSGPVAGGEPRCDSSPARSPPAQDSCAPPAGRAPRSAPY